MPPDDALYMQNDRHTEEYQYAPSKNAKMTVAIAYSSAATRVEAVIGVNGTDYTVPGIMGAEDTEHQTEDITSINLWNFWQVKQAEETEDRQPLPEGRWTLKSITLYGVYYDGTYYDDKAGVTVDLSGENITTKVVNEIVVTLSGTSRNFTGYFMDDHKVNDLTVTVADYEGQPIAGIAAVSDIKVSYQHGAVGLDSKYGYTGGGTAAVTNSTSSLKSGSQTVYQIGELNFREAGLYTQATVQFRLGEDTITAGKEGTGTVLKYVVGGNQSDNAPRFEVTWTAPDVKFTATNPEVNKRFDGDTNNSKSDVEAVYNRIRADKSSTVNLGKGEAGYYMESHYQASYSSCFGTITAYTQSKATAQLNNAGTKFTKATFTVPSKNYPNQNLDMVFSFTQSSLSNQQNVGGKSGDSRRVLGSTTATTIVLECNGVSYTVKLAHQLDVYNPN